MLPQVEDIVGESRLQDEAGIDGLRHVHRLREVSIGSVVTAMAEHRLKLADRSNHSQESSFNSPMVIWSRSTAITVRKIDQVGLDPHALPT